MATEVNCGFEVFIPKKTLNYEATKNLKARFWTSACLQIAVPTDEEPDWEKIKSSYDGMMAGIAEIRLKAENSKVNEFVDFCDKKRKNFPAPPTQRIYEG